MSISKFTRLTERPECPHCAAKNDPPHYDFDATRDMRCPGCTRTYKVTTHLRYSTEALPDELDTKQVRDFVCGLMRDHMLTGKPAREAEALAASTASTAAQKNAERWSLFEYAFPELLPLRNDGRHNFQLLADNVTLRVYHAEDCSCKKAE